MSRTHKTDPYWVKLKKMKHLREESHNHTKGVCDIAEPTGGNWRTPFSGGVHCQYTINYYGYNGGFFNSTSRWAQAEIKRENGGDRCTLRKDVCNMRNLDIEELEDYDVINPRHRHSVLWDF